MSLAVALINLSGRLTILLVQLSATILFGLAKAFGAAVAKLWRERQSRQANPWDRDHHRPRPRQASWRRSPRRSRR